MKQIDTILEQLSHSTFRSRFHLTEKDDLYIKEKGLPVIEQHAREFIQKRIAPEVLPNDGKQTPMKGHPVFIAQHATATCCRNCIQKWNQIPRNRALTKTEQDCLVRLIMTWIQREIKKNQGEFPEICVK